MTGSRWRDAGYALTVLIGLAALALVPAVVSAGLPEAGPPLHRPVEIGYGASVDPPAGARLDVADSRPGGGEVVLLPGGALRVRLSAVAYEGRPGPFIAHARHRIARDEPRRPSGPGEPFTTPSGLRGEWGTLTAASTGGRPGCYAVLVGKGVALTVLAAPVDGCAALPAPVRAALLTLRVAESA